MSNADTLPITIAKFYDRDVLKVLMSWEQHEDWIVVRFQGRCHRWHFLAGVWTPASATPLRRIFRQEWTGETALPIDCGSYLVEGYALEDGWDTVLAALDPFYLAAFYNDYDPDYLDALKRRLTHLRPEV